MLCINLWGFPSWRSVVSSFPILGDGRTLLSLAESWIFERWVSSLIHTNFSPDSSIGIALLYTVWYCHRKHCFWSKAYQSGRNSVLLCTFTIRICKPALHLVLLIPIFGLRFGVLSHTAAGRSVSDRRRIKAVGNQACWLRCTLTVRICKLGLFGKSDSFLMLPQFREYQWQVETHLRRSYHAPLLLILCWVDRST